MNNTTYYVLESNGTKTVGEVEASNGHEAQNAVDEAVHRLYVLADSEYLEFDWNGNQGKVWLTDEEDKTQTLEHEVVLWVDLEDALRDYATTLDFGDEDESELLDAYFRSTEVEEQNADNLADFVESYL